jgi:quinol monooxygenase YgiN
MRRTVALAVLLVGLAMAGTFAYQARAQQPAAPAAAPAPVQPPGPVHVITFVDITPNNKDAGTELCKQYIADTRKDPGVTRAELLVQTNRPNHVVLDVVFQNQAAYERHVSAQHTKDFHAKMIPIIGSPFDERPHYALQ